MNELINKSWYMHMMEYYAATKRSEVLIDAKTWMNLKTVMLSERNQSYRSLIVWFYLYESFGIGESRETESR